MAIIHIRTCAKYTMKRMKEKERDREGEANTESTFIFSPNVQLHAKCGKQLFLLLSTWRVMLEITLQVRCFACSFFLARVFAADSLHLEFWRYHNQHMEFSGRYRVNVQVSDRTNQNENEFCCCSSICLNMHIEYLSFTFFVVIPSTQSRTNIVHNIT